MGKHHGMKDEKHNSAKSIHASKTLLHWGSRKTRNVQAIMLSAMACSIIVSGVMWLRYSALLIKATTISSEKYAAISRTSIDESLEPIRFISVAGLYHTGSTAMWNSIHINENITKSKGINLTAYAMTDSGGYPPCGVPLLQDSSVDMGQLTSHSSGIVDSNPLLFANWGALWGDWHPRGPSSPRGVLTMKPPHQQEVFYTWWKHTPPQHPMLACFRPDTLYVVMIRHPKSWEKSMKKKLYDFKYDKGLKQWRLIRSDPRRLPPLEMRFRSLFHAWAYFVNGYLNWEFLSAGKNCYESISDGSLSSYHTERKAKCLGGKNTMPSNQRNMVIIRYEDFIADPKTTLAQIFSFASRGIITVEKDRDDFVLYDEDRLKKAVDTMENLKGENFFSSNDESWEDANGLPEICAKSGYSCDESPEFLLTKLWVTNAK